jgi:transcriptional regulator with XRE-family HTH domain
MPTVAAPPTTQTVPLAGSVVNSLLPMTTRGARLQAYLAAKTGGRRGWQTALVKTSGVKRQTITKWTHPEYDRYPDLDTLAALAAALGVSVWEIVAAMDGEAPILALDEQTQRAIQAAVDQALTERLGPPKQPRGSDA